MVLQHQRHADIPLVARDAALTPDREAGIAATAQDPAYPDQGAFVPLPPVFMVFPTSTSRRGMARVRQANAHLPWRSSGLRFPRMSLYDDPHDAVSLLVH